MKPGGCVKYMNESGTSVTNSTFVEMPSGKDCKLECVANFAPQKDQWVTSPDTHVKCEDGKLTGPDEYTVCSRVAFEAPPVVFLAAFTLAALVAGRRLEARQRSFEATCRQALRPQSFGGAGGDADPKAGSKFKQS